MPKKPEHINRFLLGLTITIVILGFLIFFSATLGIIADSNRKFTGILLSQIGGILLGFLLLFLFQKFNYLNWKKFAFWILVLAFFFNFLVFTPLAIEYGGARRWIDLGFTTIQPAEFLKVAAIMYLAGWFSWIRKKKKDLKHSVLIPFLILAPVLLMFVLQNDGKSIVLTIVAAASLMLVSRIPLRNFLFSGLIIAILFGGLIALRPHIRNRIQTFINPSQDVQGISWHLNRSLDAIRSGGIWGRGQSVKKFTSLPEPHGDSVFAVLGEEYGFVGTSLFVILFTMLAITGLKVAKYANDDFGRLLATGIVILIISQAFWNIGSMVGILPLTGIPLTFVSHGGTSIAISLAMVGILLNISRYKKV